MKINIPILSEEKIITIKTNQKEVLKNITENEGNEWLKNFFREEAFTRSKLMIDSFELDMSNKDDPSITDFQNAKRIFENLKITPSQACDERLWMGLTFSLFYDYMKYRYPATAISIKNKWLFQNNSYKLQIFRHGLSMLWWYAFITYDENNQDNPYELTEFAFKHKDFLISIYSRNFCGSKTVSLGLIKALKKFEEDGGIITSKAIYNGVVKYVSFLGGAYIIDLLTEQEIFDKCYAHLVEIYKQEYPYQSTFK